MQVFCLLLIFLLGSCTSQQVQKDYYLGLTDTDNNAKIKLFENALSCSNGYVRRAAAEELAILMSRGSALSTGTMARIRNEARGFWAQALKTGVNKEDVLSFLFGHEINTASFNQARLFILGECEKQQLVFTESERAAIDGHHSVARLRYAEALNFFRVFLTDEELPQLFIDYPNLINDLGRAFQYTQSGSEGLTLFLKWESNLVNDNSDLRYRLVFFAARIANRSGSIAQAASLFERALDLAPSGEQRDACFWYLLDHSVSRPGVFISRLEQLIPLWHSNSYFNGLLERFLQHLVSTQDWANIIRTFNLIKDTDANIPKGAFAWVIVRVTEEGLLSQESDHDPLLLTHIAYNASSAVSIPSLYYRLQSAAALGLPFLEYAESSQEQRSEAVEFLLGFFSNNAVNFVIPHIRSLERELSPGELRVIANKLTEAGMYSQAWRLINLYINNEGYVRERRDLELLFPRPYLELTEKYANEFNIAPSLLFGLIRTESAFQSAVVSRAGAVGLTQLMPATAQEMAGRIRRAGGTDYGTNLNLSDPVLNVHIGSFYYRYLMGLFNNDLLALMAYNGGLTRVRRWQAAARNLPADLIMETANILETRDYGRRVTGFAAVYEALYY